MFCQDRAGDKQTHNGDMISRQFQLFIISFNVQLNNYNIDIKLYYDIACCRRFIATPDGSTMCSTRYTTESNCDRCFAKDAFIDLYMHFVMPFYDSKHDHFTKAGSVQT